MKYSQTTEVISAYNEVLYICKMNLENLKVGQIYTSIEIFGEDGWYQFEPNDRKGLGSIIYQLIDDGKLPFTFIETRRDNKCTYRLSGVSQLYLIDTTTTATMPGVPNHIESVC